MKNIVLIGMSGVGKTVVGKYISEKNNMKLIDTDDIIEKSSGRTIPYIFKNYGEDFFRNLEFKTINKLYCNNTVISTGGGVILNNDNINNLKKNGIIFLLKANLDTLTRNIKSSREERPLLEDNSDLINEIKKTSQNRRDLYISSSDYKIIVDNKSIEDIGDEVLYIYNQIK